MNAATAPSSRRAAVPAGRLVAMLAGAAFLLAGLAGNSFSLHVGMTTTAPAAITAGDTEVMAAPLAVTSAPSEAIGESSPSPATPGTIRSDAQHLMHLLGACMAVLAVAALLLSVLFLGRVGGGSYTADPAVPRLDAPTPRAAWSPPALSPPTSSPVIRT